MSSTNLTRYPDLFRDHFQRAKSNLSPSITQCRLLTGPGRSAIAVIELLGIHAPGYLRDHFYPATTRPWAVGQIRYGRWGDLAIGESVVVTPLSEGHFEIQCHGGAAAIERILQDLQTSGAVNSSSDPPLPRRERWIAEATETLTRCQTMKTAAIAMDQVRGAFADWAEGLETMDAAARQQAIGPVMARARWTMRLDRPFDVVLVGPPNVGKSSLINALVGYERSIVMNQPGTTRDVLAAETVVDGWPIRFRDTAGLRDTEEAIEREGIERAKSSAADADLVLRIGTPDVPAPDDSNWKETLTVLNKRDTADERALPDHDVATVAIRGDGIPTLQDRIIESLVSDRSGLAVQSATSPTPLPAILTRGQWEWVASQCDPPFPGTESS